MAQSGAVEAPTIDVKEGGKVSGYGEKFNVNLISGTPGFSLPLQAPQVRDTSLGLALSYSGTRQNGPYGVGFTLEMPAISRLTDHGIPRYDARDRFVLAGSELTPQYNLVDGNWVKDERDDGAYRIIAYRQRSESTFSRIEWWVHQDGVNSYWKVLDSENNTTIYGGDAGSRICDPDYPERIFQWSIASRTDPKGNRTTYTYRHEDADNLPPLNGHGIGAQLYIQSIFYGNYLDSGQQEAFAVEIAFDYGDYDLAVSPVSPVRSWTVRHDPFSSYRSGFEIRTWRLCRNILTILHFPDRPEVGTCLTAVLALQYEESAQCTLLASVQRIGYRKNSAGTYQTEAMPPVAFKFGAFTMPDAPPAPLRFDGEPAANGLIGDGRYQFVDLFGDGIPGILFSGNGVSLYWPALGEGCYAPPVTPLSFPIDRTLSNGSCVLMDVDGNGHRDLVVRIPGRPGFYRNNNDGNWESFVPFSAAPPEMASPNAILTDLSGGGRQDIMAAAGPEKIRVYRSRGYKGFDPPALHVVPGGFPQSDSRSQVEMVGFASLFGDGLAHRFRLRDGRIEIWPSLGYGFFGDPVAMLDVPRFGASLKASRIFFADLSGNGFDDLIYAYPDRLEIHLNQSGNGFGAPITVPVPQQIEDDDQINWADVTGSGQAAFVLSKALGDIRHYALPFGVADNAYLLRTIDNNYGARTEIAYRSSTSFQLADRRIGRLWATPLSMVVQVVDELVVTDLNTGLKNTTRYQYSDGYYDPVEREFRGFGYVQVQDTQVFGMQAWHFPAPARRKAFQDDDPVDPCLTKHWNSTGAAELSQRRSVPVPDFDGAPIVPPDLLADDIMAVGDMTVRDAYRALKDREAAKSTLRVEDDGTPGVTPFQSTGQNYKVVMLQPRIDGHPGAFQVTQLQSRSVRYECAPEEPMVEDSANLATDTYGNVTLSVSVNYPRPGDPAKHIGPQRQLSVVAVQSAYINHPDTAAEPFRYIGLKYQQRTLEVNGLDAGGSYFTLDTLIAKVGMATQAGAIIPYGAPFTSGILQSRPFRWTRDYYWNAARTAPLPFGQVAAQGLVHHQQAAIFSEDFVTGVFGTRVTPAMLEASGGAGCGYINDDGYWWNAGLVRVFGDAATYCSVLSAVDPFGGITSYGYDPYYIAMTSVTDALGQVSHTDTDYQVLKPWRVIDVNQNSVETAYGPLGAMVAFSRLGSFDGHAYGDRSLDGYTYIVPANRDEIIADPEKFLQGAGSYYYEDFLAFSEGEGPVNSIHVEASRYITPLDPSEPGIRSYDIGLTFVDGNVRILAKQQRVEAAAVGWTGAGMAWVTAEQVTYNEQGRVARRYNPYLVETAGFIPNPPVPFDRDFYDAVGRLRRSDTSKGFFSKTEYGTWARVVYDQDDTIQDSPYYKANIGNTDPAFANELDALKKAAVFQDTPTTIATDPMGRDVLTQQINLLVLPPDPPPPREVLLTGTWRDIAGNVVEEADPRFYNNGTPVTFNFVRSYDMTGKQVSALSADRGRDRSGLLLQLGDISGSPLFEWDNRGCFQVWSYDILRRPLGVTVHDGEASYLAESMVYGTDAATNTRNQVVIARDQSQQCEYPGYDLQSQPLSSARRFTKSYDGSVDWSQPDKVPLLDERWVQSATRNRREWPLLQTDADGSVQAIRFYLNGWVSDTSCTYAGTTVQAPVILSSVYGPNNSPVAIDFANRTRTQLTYDPCTLRLASLVTQRQTDQTVLQDRNYYYDAVGNVTRIADLVPPPDTYRNTVAEALNDYTYDAVYRLRQSKGRQQATMGLGGHGPQARPDLRAVAGPDDNRLVPYEEWYQFDPANNLTQIRHSADTGSGQGNWTKTFVVSQSSNHAVPEDMVSGGMRPDDFFDANGNLDTLENLRAIAYDYRNRMGSVTLIQRPGGDNDAQYYRYDRDGMRRRKTTVRQLANASQVEDTFYIGNYILTRITQVANDKSTLVDEADSLRVTVGGACALIRDRDVTGGTPPLLRYQIADNQRSVALELDEAGLMLTYEEYFPFGTIAVSMGKTERDIKSKRYRFVGKELDQATGLYYIGARYYIPWMGRWTTPDPTGAQDGLNLYAYVGGNPTSCIDPTGTVATQLTGTARQVQDHQATMDGDMDRALEMVNSAIDILQANVVSRNNFIVSALWSRGTISQPDELVQKYFGIRGTSRTDANNLIEILDNFIRIRDYLSRPAVTSRLSWAYVKSFFVNTPRFNVRTDTRESRGTIAYVQGASLNYPDWKILPPSVRSRPVGLGTALVGLGIGVGLALLGGPAGIVAGIVVGLVAVIPYFINKMVNGIRRVFTDGINLYNRAHFGEEDRNVRASTIVHESSHLVLGTDDHAYGHDGHFRRLTTTQTMYNADSYGLFAQEAYGAIEDQEMM